jgi:hypothetical protein
MIRKLVLLVAVGMVLAFGNFAFAGEVDVIQAPTGNFVPTDAQKYDSPYYRWYGEDWGWTHNAIGLGGFATAELKISAYDVDADNVSYPEVDKIYAYDDGVKTYLGNLLGGNDQWAYSTFTLGSNFFDDIKEGLQVYIEIDTDSQERWAVTLAKSTLSLDGEPGPGPDPGQVPEPLTMLLLSLGLTGIAGARRFTK